MADPTPIDDLLVNDRYWLGFARKMIDAGVTRRDDAAGKLVTAIGWFWTAYSAAAIVGVALADRHFSAGVAALIVAPAALLIIAYLGATWALMPIDVVFDPRIPDQVKEAHVVAMGKKRNRLRGAAVLTAIAAGGVIVAIVATASAPPVAQRSFHATAVTDGSNVQVLFTGSFAKSQEVTVTAILVDAGASTPARSLFVASNAGGLQGSLSVPMNADGYRVTASWTENDIDYTTTVAVESPPGA